MALAIFYIFEHGRGAGENQSENANEDGIELEDVSEKVITSATHAEGPHW